MQKCKRFSFFKSRYAAAMTVVAMMGGICVQAATLFVAPDGAGTGSGWADAASISALAEVGSGDTVFLKEGTYEMSSGIEIVGKELSIRGGYSGEGEAKGGETVLVMTSALRHFTISANAVVLLEGLTLTGGSQINGNAISAQASEVTVRNCVLRNNETSKESKGGGHLCVARDVAC